MNKVKEDVLNIKVITTKIRKDTSELFTCIYGASITDLSCCELVPEVVNHYFNYPGSYLMVYNLLVVWLLEPI